MREAEHILTRPTRRAFLGGVAGGAVALRAGLSSAAPLPGIEILCAPTGASITLARAFDSGALSAAAPDASFRVWRDNDELRAGIVSGKTRLFSTPTHVPANLANRGMPIKLLCLLGEGHLYIVTADEKISSFADLAGKPILGFFRNDMPDLVFRACARMEGLDPDKDFQLTYVESGMAAAQTLAAGRATTAILSEPPSTAAIMMAGQQGRTLRRAISLQEVYGRHRETKGIPMVGVAVHASLVEESPQLLAALREALPAAKAWALANRAEAAALAEKRLQMRAPVFEKAMDYMNIDVRSARDAKAEIASFYQTLIDAAPDALAGKLPGDDFYLGL